MQSLVFRGLEGFKLVLRVLVRVLWGCWGLYESFVLCEDFRGLYGGSQGFRWGGVGVRV